MLPCLEVFFSVCALFCFPSNIVLLLPWGGVGRLGEMHKTPRRLSKKETFLLFSLSSFFFCLCGNTTKCLEKYLKLISNVVLDENGKIRLEE
jgi:hypothetical protein